MEVGGYIVTLNDVFIVCCLCNTAVMIARLVLRKLKNREAKNGIRKS